jgi:Lecithin:cholesterol acyltransferase
MKRYLFPIVVIISFFYFHSAKADVYFSQPNSNGYDYFEFINFGHQGHSFQGDDGTLKLFSSRDVELLANFGSGNNYPIPTTSVTSYVTDIILQIKDSNITENANYGFHFECQGQGASFDQGVYQSSFVNSSTYSNGFVNVDFKFTGPNCDLSKYQIHMLSLVLPNSLNTGQTTLQVRSQNINSVSGFGATNSNGDILEDYEPMITIQSAPFVSKTPILIIPGVMGTDIYKGTDLLWANPKMSFVSDGFMDPLAFNSSLSPIDSSLTLGSVIRDKSIGIFHSDYTQGLISQLTSTDIGYTEGKDLFTFPYDWRFGISEDTINRLKGEIAFIANTTGSSVVNIVAHSTGGLLVKKYVMENPTSNGIGKAVFVGVPNLGAPKALKALIVGDGFDVPALNPAEMKKLAQNMPAIYDLAPSNEYYNQAGSFLTIYNPSNTSHEDTDLNFAEAMQNLMNNNYANPQAVASSSNLHSEDFDNYDLRNEGVNLYNIVGCKAGTFGKFTESVKAGTQPTYNFPKVISGDGTVPFVSADNLSVDGTKTFFVQNMKHGDLLSQDGPRQQIINLLTGSTLSTNGKVLTRSEVFNKPSLCEINGESIKIHSPLALDIIDQDGNHSGPFPDGSIENSIPGADYEVWGEEKYVFLPTDGNQNYQISLAGTGSGTFTLDDESISAGATTRTQVFSNLPVTTALTGHVNLSSGGGQTTLTLQATPTSTPFVVIPSSTINGDQSQDLTSPVSTSTVLGLLGITGAYKSTVFMNVYALDPITNNNPAQTSGVLKIQYNLDNAGYKICTIPPLYASTSAKMAGDLKYKGYLGCGISITADGNHTIKFFSTDKAGNNESEQSFSFVINKNAP